MTFWEAATWTGLDGGSASAWLTSVACGCWVLESTRPPGVACGNRELAHLSWLLAKQSGIWCLNKTAFVCSDRVSYSALLMRGYVAVVRPAAAQHNKQQVAVLAASH